MVSAKNIIYITSIYKMHSVPFNSKAIYRIIKMSLLKYLVK